MDRPAETRRASPAAKRQIETDMAMSNEWEKK